MSTDPRLTILLTLKGRHLFTLRWLWHANRTHLPFRIFIADGQVHPAIARLVEDRALFPNLDVEYQRYNDRTFYDYYRKLQDALSKIKTPYVMLSDNDDFLFPSGIARSLNDLERSPDYISVGGGIGHFKIGGEENQFPNLYGPIEKIWFQQAKAYQSFELNQLLASDRVSGAFAGSLTVHYNVDRVEALCCIADELILHNFETLEIGEQFWRLRLATLGKVKSDPSCVSYFRQLGTSLNPSREKDFIRTISNEQYVAEMQTVVKIIASLVAKNDGIDQKVIEEKLGEIAAEQLRQRLVLILGWRTEVKSWIKKAVPELLLERLRGLGDRIRSGRSSATGGRAISRKGIFDLIADAGASAEFIEGQRREFAGMEETLQSREFLAFVRANASEVLSEEYAMS